MSRRSKRDIVREQEVMNSPVRMDGVGEDKVIRDLVSPEFASMSDTQALDIALALQQIIRGQASLLENQKVMNEEIEKLRRRMAEYDESARQWEKDRLGFVENLEQQAEKIKMGAADREKLLAQESIRLQNLITEARAKQAVSKMQFDVLLDSMPKETITSSGNIVKVRNGASFDIVIEPEVLKIRHRTWVLPPNCPVEVPSLVADVWRRRQKDKEAAQMRKSTLSLNNGVVPEQSEAARRWDEVNKKYGEGDLPALKLAG